MRKINYLFIIGVILISQSIVYSHALPTSKEMDTNFSYSVAVNDYLVYNFTDQESNIIIVDFDKKVFDDVMVKNVSIDEIEIIGDIFDEISIDLDLYQDILYLEIESGSTDIGIIIWIDDVITYFNSTFGEEVTILMANSTTNFLDYDIVTDVTGINIYVREGIYRMIDRSMNYKLFTIEKAILDNPNEYSLDIDIYNNVSSSPNFATINNTQWSLDSEESYTINRSLCTIVEPIILIPTDIDLDDYFSRELGECIVYFMSGGSVSNFSFMIDILEDSLGVPLTEDNYTIYEDYGVSNQQGYVNYTIIFDLEADMGGQIFDIIFTMTFYVMEIITLDGKKERQHISMTMTREVYYGTDRYDYGQEEMLFLTELVYDSNPYIAPEPEDEEPELLTEYLWYIIGIVIASVVVLGGVGLYYYMNRQECMDNPTASLCASKYRTYQRE